jgi:hypothetical protein
MKFKKYFLGLSLGLLGMFAQAQNGLENLIVEKYYVSNAADAAGSVGTLPEGSVTWRFYADLLPGYKFVMAYGDVNHRVYFHSSTSFFNNEDRGATTPSYSKTQARSNTVMLDSWLSVGAACSGNFGVLKTEDDGVSNVVNSNGLLANNDASAGIPLTTQDGLLAGTPFSTSFIGISDAQLSVFNATSQAGNTFTTNDGAWFNLDGSVGPFPATNRVLIAQITTDGILDYELNIQLGTPTGGVQKFVASNPLLWDGVQEVTLSSLSGRLFPGNVKPTVSITAPAAGSHSITGDVVAISADAADADGSVASVQFFVDGISVGTDVTAPYSVNYTGVAGNHAITAVATDNSGATTTSAAVNVSVGNDLFPVVSITSPAAGSSSIVGDVVSIAANATDDGTISSVEFFVDGVSVGVDNSAPYTASYTGAFGSHNITARATDNRAQSTTSSLISILVRNNTPPSVSVTAPVSGSNVTMNVPVAITANASDADGSVASVEFRVNGISLGVDNSAPYSVNYTPAAEGSASIIAIATDNRGLTTTSSAVVVNVNDPNALPYVIKDTVQTCLPGSAYMTVVSTKATMASVNGYDIVMNYNANKVRPTKNLTLSNDLINSSLTSYMVNIDSVRSLVNILINLNGQAPIGTAFHGAGKLFSLQFTKTANFRSVDTAVFSISSLEESYLSGSASAKLVKSGRLITYKDSTFHGSLRFWGDNSPIRYDVANPNDYLITNIRGCTNSAVAVQPDVNGNFTYNIWNGTSINIDRDVLPTTNVHSVIMAADAYYTSLIAVKNTSVFIPNIYQMIAMDVTGDGKITAGDVSQINQRAAMIIPQFSQVWNASNGRPSKDWLFVNSTVLASSAYQISATYPESDNVGFSKYRVPVVDFCQTVPVVDYTECPLISSDIYTGVMLGDVDASYSGIAHDGLLKSTSDDNEVVLDLSKSTTVNGVITIPVSISTSMEVHAIDLGFTVNKDKVEKVEPISQDNNPNNISPLDLGYNAETGRVDIAGSSSDKGIPSNKAFTISVILKDNAKLQSSDFVEEQTNLTGQAFNSTVDGHLKVVESPTSTNNYTANMVKIYPNPATNVLNIEVPENSKIEIFELSGKQVVLETSIEANNTQSINLQDLSSGVYIVKVTGESFVKMQRVVVNK